MALSVQAYAPVASLASASLTASSSSRRSATLTTTSPGSLRLAASPKALFRPLPSTTSRRARIVCEATETKSAGAVTDATFKKLVLDSDIPVLVDFWAPWCGPCRMIAPLIDELAVQYEGKIKCLKLNTDESPGVATEYGIRSIPTVMIFKGGKKVDTVIGAVPKSTLTNTIDKYL